VIIIGVDCHTRVHVGAEADAQGRALGMCEVDASEACLARLLSWLQAFPGDRLVAVEGAHGFGLPLTRRLLAMGEKVVDLPSQLTAVGRRSARYGGKDDQGDALVIARVALREPKLSRVQVAHLDTDLKLLVDARDQVVAEATRVRNRLHALLLILAPGYRAQTGALISNTALATARRLVLRAREADPIRAQLALAAIRRLHELEMETSALERQIKDAIVARQPTRLLSICGVGPIVAAKLLGETHAVARFPPRRPSPLIAAPHQCRPPAASPSGLGSIVAATAN
jgi:transposase